MLASAWRGETPERAIFVRAPISRCIFRMRLLLQIARSRRLHISGSIAVGCAVGGLTVHHFVSAGWPLRNPNVPLVLLAAGLFLAAYATKALGWRRLFRRDVRPGALALAAAGGAASVTGVALPGRFDDVVRIAVVRRFPGPRAGFGAICLSLFLLGLLDSAALTPLASVAAAVTDTSTVVRAGLIAVAAAGVGATGVVLALPYLSRLRWISHLRLCGWLREHSACPREASKAWVYIAVSWGLRAVALVVLLEALSLGGSFRLALAFLVGSSASAALPIAPAGAATQAGAGAVMLVTAGVKTSEAAAFALAAQTLGILIGALVLLGAAAWHIGQRWRTPAVAL